MAQSGGTVPRQEAVERLQLQITQIQQESQKKLEELQRQTALKLQQLQAQIEQLTAKEVRPVEESDPGPEDLQAPAKMDSFSEKFDISGDFRLRYEYNSSYAGAPAWDRGVVRGRLAASYDVSDQFRVGARVVTGDADNPRTSDLTLGNFLEDFELSLDQAYVSFENGNLFLTGGKFAQPFTSTELAWDGDVNPQGLGVRYNFFENEGWSAWASGTYFIIDQDSVDKESDMLGGQLSVKVRPNEKWEFALHSAYYDYDISAVDPGMPGGPRGNNVTQDGRYYISDFNLLDAIGTVTYKGFGERREIRFVADYVKNLGAEVPEDTGYGFDLFVGSLSRPGDFQFRYGYSRVETDAVLGIFSNDNITYPTNYVLHAASVDYALRWHTYIGLTSYLYRRADKNLSVLPNDWLSRTRLNLYFTF